MKAYEVKIEKEKIYKAVYNITANAAQQRGDALHVATEDNINILEEFLEEGRAVVAAALGKYGNGGVKYSMPASWDFKEEVDEKAHAFLVGYIVARWMGLTAQVEIPVLELMSILNKRNKPI